MQVPGQRYVELSTLLIHSSNTKHSHFSLCSNTTSKIEPGLQREFIATSKIQTINRNIPQSSDFNKNLNMLKEQHCKIQATLRTNILLPCCQKVFCYHRNLYSEACSISHFFTSPEAQLTASCLSDLHLSAQVSFFITSHSPF